MQLRALSKVFAFVVVAQAIGIASAAPAANTTVVVNDSASSISPLDFNIGIGCSDSFLSGTCGSTNVNGIPSLCFNLLPQFDNTYTSIQVIPGITCNYFVDPNCSGAFITITGTINDLAGTNFDNSLSSRQCFSDFNATLRVIRT